MTVLPLTVERLIVSVAPTPFQMPAPVPPPFVGSPAELSRIVALMSVRVP